MTKLHIGCGPIHLDGWVNIDKERSHDPDIWCDAEDLDSVMAAGKRLFDDNSVDLVFGCHFLEHLPWPSVVEIFLSSTHKILKPGGTMRIVVPDLMKVAKMYVRGEALKDIYGIDFPIVGPDCPATRFMAFARGWEHTVLFDERLLTMLMEQAGFVNIRVMPFGESDVPELRGLDRFFSESISVEGDKP